MSSALTLICISVEYWTESEVRYLGSESRRKGDEPLVNVLMIERRHQQWCSSLFSDEYGHKKLCKNKI